MKFRSFISEMIDDELKAKTYYHGTSIEKNGLNILNKGIQPPDLTNRKGKLKPVEGKVYITSELRKAVIYTIGGDIMGSDNDSFLKRWVEKDGQYGYLFVIDGQDLRDSQPDEDEIGKLIHSGEPAWLVDMAKLHLTDRKFKKVKEGEYVEWAVAGKKLLKVLSDARKLELMKLCYNMAHDGALIPKEVWKFDKNNIPMLKKDGSNFFDLAEKVR